MGADYDVVIVGSGAAGVSAAFPLLEYGLSVLMLDVGDEDLTDYPYFESLSQMRVSNQQSRLTIGAGFHPFKQSAFSSPKFHSPTNSKIFARSSDELVNFSFASSQAKGGLTGAWGAGVSCYDDSELSAFPIDHSELAASYVAIANRIGISGSSVDDLAEFHGKAAPLQPPLNLSATSSLLMRRYLKRSRSIHAAGVKIGHGRNAVISENFGGRKACSSCGLCLWRCNNRSIYSASYDLDTLLKYDDFEYRPKSKVESISRSGDSYRLHLSHAPPLEVSRVVLACGAIGSAKLVLQALGLHDFSIRLRSNPVVPFALLVPKLFAQSPELDTYSMSQLSMRIEDSASPEGYSCGNIFPADTLMPTELMRHMPFSYPLSRKIIRQIQSSMLVGNCFFSGEYSDHQLKVDKAGKATIVGGYNPSLVDSLKQVKARLSKVFFGVGAFVLPGSFKLTTPGEDIHYASTVPMSHNPKPHESYANGEVAGLPGVYVVDGAALSTLPAKPHTYTVMANSNRVGTILAQALSAIRGVSFPVKRTD